MTGEHSIYLVVGILLSWLGICLSDIGDPYGLINRVQTECEMSSMTFGTRLSDAFNSLDESTSSETRIHHEYLVEHLGFSSFANSSLWKQSEVGIDGHTISHLQKRGGWVHHKNISHSSYWALENKWIYLVGDLSQAQLWGAMVSSHLGPDVVQEGLLDYLKSDKCTKQAEHRKTQITTDESHVEVTCHSPGFGTHGKITYDWKHLPMDEYDNWLWGESGPWGTTTTTTAAAPDVLVVQVGTHICIHGVPAVGKDVNEELVKEQEAKIPPLMQAIEQAVGRLHTTSGTNTTVIISTASRSINGDPRQGFCMWRLNRVIAHEAHLRGFTVWEREELEHRLFFKSEHTPPELALTPVRSSASAVTLLASPAPQILATTLLNMISCLAINGTRGDRVIDANRHHHHHAGHHWGAIGVER